MLRYKLLPAVGAGETRLWGSLAQFVAGLPYLLSEQVAPPHVLNEIFRGGVEDAGMSGGCRWQPFEITAEEFAEFAEHLARPPTSCRAVVPPTWVLTRRDWNAWRLEERIGVPAAETLAFDQEEDTWREAARAAQRAGDEPQATDCTIRAVLVASRKAQFFSGYVRRFHRRQTQESTPTDSLP